MRCSDDLNSISCVLTCQYLSDRLTDWFHTPVKYTGHESGSETGKGDSYLSDVYRVTVYGETKVDGKEVSVDLIIKTLPHNIARRRTFRSLDFFNNEINLYLYILPRLQETRRAANLPELCVPKMFAGLTDGKEDFLAMEDMTPEGFTTAKRQEGIDLQHCNIILERFAAFHATSFAFKDKHPEEFLKLSELLPESYYSPRHWEWYRGFWASLCPIAVDAIQKEYPDKPEYLQKVKNIASDKTFERCCEAAGYKGKSAVFGHGDSWTPNFLFRYNKAGVPDTAAMIDFQLSRCASPMLDVTFFIYATTDKPLRDSHYKHMLEHYYDCLSKEIRALGSDPDKLYSHQEFMDEVKKYSFFGLAFSFESTPVTILPPEDAFDMEAVQGTEPVRIETIWKLYPIKSQAGRKRHADNMVHAIESNYI